MLLIRRRLTPVTALGLLFLGLALPSAVAAAPPAGWGWVVARNSTSSSYIPAAKDQGNSSGMSNSVQRTARGRYFVVLPGVNTSDGGGHVQVSALGDAQRYCSVDSWGPADDPATDMEVSLSCYRFSGVTGDSAFTLFFLTRGYDSGNIAYAWADQPAATDYTTNAFYSTPTNITVHRSSAGQYLVRLPNSDPDHGNVQVTGYGGAICHTGETSSDGTALIVGVTCPLGDSRFDVLYTKNVGLAGVVRPKAAYLRGFPLRSGASRTPAQFRYSTAASAPTISRTSVGVYLVTLPGMPKGGAAHITAGPGADTCYLTSIRTTATPQKIGVACANLSGTPSDAAFDLSYTK